MKPKSGDLSTTIAALSPTKRALFERRVKSLDGDSSHWRQELPIERVARDRPLPLSFAEQRLWFLEQYQPGTATHNLRMVLRIRGKLNVAALERSIAELVMRHESLRTRFVADGGTPLRVIDSALATPVEFVSVEDAAPAEREEAVVRLLGARRSVPFDLSLGPVFRATIARLAEEEHVVLLVMHHIVSDGWSTGVLQRELSALYGAFVRGAPTPLRALPLQYADYAVWERASVEDERSSRQLARLKQHLTGVLPLDLPTDRPRPAEQSTAGAAYSFALGADLTVRLKSLGRREGATLFMTLLSAFSLWLARHAGQLEFAVGTPIAHRTHGEVESIVGCFVNTLALRVDLTGGPAVRQMLARTRAEALRAFANQDVPFDHLVRELQPLRDLSRPPLCQVMFVMQNASRERPTLPGLAVEPFPLPSQVSTFDLTLFFREQNEDLVGTLEYATALFDVTTIERMVGRLRVLLDAMVTTPERGVLELPLLTETERQTLLVTWNDTRAEYRKDQCIHQLFEEQVEKTPDAVALVFEDERLTYRQVDARSNRLAHALRALGVGPDVLVGICVERSIEMVIALMATLKAGGAYVPVDPRYPSDRVALMLQDSDARFVVTEGRLTDRFVGQDVELVFVDDATTPNDTSRLPNVTHTENLSYVIYTSGSTGRPKGVMVPHASVASFLAAMDGRIGMDPEGVWLAVTSVSFDISVLELFWTLTRGFRVVIRPDQFSGPGADKADSLGDEISRHGVTHLQCTPSLFGMQMEGEGRQAFRSLKKLLLGGEPLPSHLARQATAVIGGELLNMYGPTETTVWSSSHVVRNSEDPVPIGHPIANTQMYVVDDEGQPVPTGVAGELLVGGDGITRGYFGRPEQTATRFVPDPFGTTRGGRLYRTGDLVRWLPDGNLEFLGRIDQQVKIRGFRVELGEIESQLSAHASVGEAVVSVREDVPGDKRLVAYVTAKKADVPPTSEALREHLRQKVPEYMVPNSLVVLDALPLTPNGKLDRKALPAPDMTALGGAYVEPRTADENVLAGIWCAVLRRPRIGVTDNFFELGGHSLLAVQVVARVLNAFDVQLPLVAIFEAPTIEGIAERILEIQLRDLPVEMAADLLERAPHDRESFDTEGGVDAGEFRRADDVRPRAARETLGTTGGKSAVRADQTVDLSEEGLLTAARRACGGLDAWGGDDFREPLRVLLGSVDTEGALTKAGRRTFHALVQRLLMNRLQIQATIAHNPSIRRVEVREPIFIVGWPRTGTTLLHSLIALDRANRAPRLWELLYPAPPAPGEPDFRLDAARFFVEQRSAEASKIHGMVADGPDECSFLLQNAIHSRVFDHFRAITYIRWLKAHDAHSAYEYYKLQLQLLLWQRPGARLVLKAPEHMASLGALFSVFPDAKIVMTHRDPLESLPSTCSLQREAMVGTSESPYDVGDAERAADSFAYLLQSGLRTREKMPPERFCDVFARDIFRDAVGGVRRIYDYFGLELTAEFEGAMRAWLADNPRNKLGQHRYSLEEFGLDAGTIRARFGEYYDRFRVGDRQDGGRG